MRVFGHGEATITRWRNRAAHQAERAHRHFLYDLQLPHLKLGEIRARLRPRGRVTWFWLVLDPRTKLIPALALGPRTQHTAHALVHALRATLAPACSPLVTTDGFRLYFYALTAHFGLWVGVGRQRRWAVDPALLIGQIHKGYRRRRLVRIRYQMRCGSRHALHTALRQRAAHPGDGRRPHLPPRDRSGVPQVSVRPRGIRGHRLGTVTTPPQPRWRCHRSERAVIRSPEGLEVP